jgi:hypothetical protein
METDGGVFLEPAVVAGLMGVEVVEQCGSKGRIDFGGSILLSTPSP